MCLQVFTFDFDLSLVLKIGIKNIFYKVACFKCKNTEKIEKNKKKMFNSEEQENYSVFTHS